MVKAVDKILRANTLTSQKDPEKVGEYGESGESGDFGEIWSRLLTKYFKPICINKARRTLKMLANLAKMANQVKVAILAKFCQDCGQNVASEYIN